jgi:hypothetical protein
VGRIPCSQCTSHMAAITSGRILAAYRSRLLASSPRVISRSAFRYSSPTGGSSVLAIIDAVGSSTWRADVAALCIASIEDTAALTYDFHTTHDKTSLCKNMSVCLLDYFAFLTRSFTCLSRRLRITTRRWAGILLHQRPLEPDGRIRQQRCGTVVLVSFVF